ncbi:MAG: efflux RND transporter periplasmic adaptor subunit [Chloroflexota bacterium]
MKPGKMVLLILVMAGLLVPIVGCASQPASSAVAEGQTVTVQPGDLTVDVTAAGNLALSRTEDLAFEMAGTVEAVDVQAGDAVKQGQELARLDTSEWEDTINTLEDAVTTAERGVTTKQRSLFSAQISVKNAQVALSNAQDTWLDTVWAGSLVRQAQRYLDYLQSDNVTATDEELSDATKSLNSAWARFNSIAKPSEDVKAKEMSLELANLQLGDARVAVTDAEKAVTEAQKSLDEARQESPIITAPFDGFVTTVSVIGGDEIKKGTVALQIADPTKFEADIMVSEMDIMQVKLGGKAQVGIDAVPGLTIPATVTHVSPTATIQSGVVNYQVTVELGSLQDLAQQQAARQSAAGAAASAAPGSLPQRLQQAVDEGRMTQQQAEAMMQQIASGQGGQVGQAGAAPAVVPPDFQLREGLTATVSIVVAQRTGVLLVPNSAITSQGGQSYVQVVAADGTATDTKIQTGLSDWQHTEVTSGLSEGDKILVPQGTAAVSTGTPTGQGPQGGMFIPGMGRVR